MKTGQLISAFAIAVSVLSGCTAIQPLPIAARSGDTVTMALGSQHDLSKANTTITITDAAGGTYSVAPKSVFNLYPDRRSKVYDASSNANLLVAGTGHEQWATVLVFNVPAGVQPGMATINVNTSGAQASLPNSKVQDVNYPLEILSGSGSPHKLQYSHKNAWGGTITSAGNLASLEPINNQVYVIPPTTFVCGQTFGAIEFRFHLPFNIEPYKDYERIRIVADDFSTYTQQKPSEVSWVATGDELRVIFLSSDGGVACYEPRFSIVPKLTANGAEFTTLPELISVTYYDTNGAVVTGPDQTAYQIVLK